MKKFDDGHYHLEEALKAEKVGDHTTARSEYYKSVSAFTQNEIKPGCTLTPREHEVYSMLIAGIAPKEIAAALGVSYKTVHFHQKNLYRKLDIQSRAELFALHVNKPRQKII